MTPIITVSGVSFELPNGRLLFNNLNFSLETQVVALVGPNGIGKTSLAKLLASELEPTTGSVHQNGSISFFKQREPPPSIAVNEFLLTNDTWSPLKEKLLDSIDQNTLCTHLSGGEWMRVRLAQKLNDQFLILDEPTNDLDREGREALLHFLQKHKGGILLISHDRECLELCKEVLELSNRGLSKFGFGWSEYTNARSQEREGLQKNLELAKRSRDFAKKDRIKQKDRQEKRNRQGAESAARGGMPKILLGARKRQAQVSTGQVDSDSLERNENAIRNLHNSLQELKTDLVMYSSFLGKEIPSQKLVIEASQFNIRFHDWLYPKDLNFTLRGNIRLALKGPNGSGKSTLLKAIFANSFETRGEFHSGDLVKLYIDQTCSTLDDSKSILENVRETAISTESEIRNGLAQFLFMKESVFQKVADLSGGERLRAALAKGFLSTQKPELLILDEPTNNLDLVNIEFLENLISQFRGALIIISHDEVFLKNCDVTETLNVTS